MSPSEKKRGTSGATPRKPQSPAVRRALRRGPAYRESRLVLGKLNYALLGAAAVSIVLGFLLLARRETSLAPALLVLGYCILIPAALLLERVPGRTGSDRPGSEGSGE